MNNDNFTPISENELKNAQKTGAERLFSSLSDKDKETVTNILADEEKLRQMLKSPAAAAIFKMLKNGGKNG